MSNSNKSSYVRSDVICRYLGGMRSSYDPVERIVYPNKLVRDEVRVFDHLYFNPNMKKINYLYALEKRDGAGSVGKEPAIVSLITDKFTTNPRSQNKNMAYVARKYTKPQTTLHADGTKTVEVMRIEESPTQLKDVFDFIKKWDETAGKKYGMMLTSSFDKNFFMNHFEYVKDKVQSLFFYLDNVETGTSRLVGYSILELPTGERDDGYLISRYAPGKADITCSNLTQFIDFESFRRLRERVGEDFILHWGSASKNIRTYEQRNFPFYREDCYFTYTIRPIQKTTKKLF